VRALTSPAGARKALTCLSARVLPFAAQRLALMHGGRTPAAGLFLLGPSPAVGKAGAEPRFLSAAGAVVSRSYGLRQTRPVGEICAADGP
jgi:hypothetical protein